METHKLYWQQWKCSIDELKLNKELIELIKCKTCGKSRIDLSLHISDGKQTLMLAVNKSVCGEDLCERCDENLYYKDIENPLLS